MIVGVLLVMVQQFGLYAVSYINNATLFFMLCVVFQMIGGLGSGNNNVASLAVVIADTPKSDRVEAVGLVEMAGGIGFLIGPVWGSLMF